MFGVGKSWSRTDAERLIHQLTMDGYLHEIHVASYVADGIVNAYIKIGRNAQLLLSGKSKVSVV